MSERLDAIEKQLGTIVPDADRILTTLESLGVPKSEQFDALVIVQKLTQPDTIRDLLTLARKQAAALEAVRELHSGNQWGFCNACSEHIDIPMPCPTRAALERS